MNPQQLKNIIEAALLAAGEPLSIERLLSVFGESPPERTEVRAALDDLAQDYAGRGVELIEVGSGFRLQVRQEYAQWVSRLWEERPARYSRALLETLALIAYRQPITRAEIEDIRGVGVSTHIVKTLHEREWIRVLGHRDVPGKPALYGTTRHFLDHFNLKSLDELPTLAEIRDLDNINIQLDLGELPPESDRPTPFVAEGVYEPGGHSLIRPFGPPSPTAGEGEPVRPSAAGSLVGEMNPEQQQQEPG